MSAMYELLCNSECRRSTTFVAHLPLVGETTHLPLIGGNGLIPRLRSWYHKPWNKRNTRSTLFSQTELPFL